MGNLTIETAGTEEEAAENIQVALNMEIEEADVDLVKGEEGYDVTLSVLGSL